MLWAGLSFVPSKTKQKQKMLNLVCSQDRLWPRPLPSGVLLCGPVRGPLSLAALDSLKVSAPSASSPCACLSLHRLSLTHSLGTQHMLVGPGVWAGLAAGPGPLAPGLELWAWMLDSGMAQRAVK